MTIVHVRLFDEGVDVWRPVEARHLAADVYRLDETPYDRAIERREFLPGARVRVERRLEADGPILVAVAPATE